MLELSYDIEKILAAYIQYFLDRFIMLIQDVILINILYSARLTNITFETPIHKICYVYAHTL